MPNFIQQKMAGLREKYEEHPINMDTLLTPCGKEQIDEFWLDIKTALQDLKKEILERMPAQQEIIYGDFDEEQDDRINRPVRMFNQALTKWEKIIKDI